MSFGQTMRTLIDINCQPYSHLKCRKNDMESWLDFIIQHNELFLAEQLYSLFARTCVLHQVNVTPILQRTEKESPEFHQYLIKFYSI